MPSLLKRICHPTTGRPGQGWLPPSRERSAPNDHQANAGGLFTVIDREPEAVERALAG